MTPPHHIRQWGKQQHPRMSTTLLRWWRMPWAGCQRRRCIVSVCGGARIARDSRMAVGFLTRATCKNVRQNLIPRAIAYFAAYNRVFESKNLLTFPPQIETWYSLPPNTENSKI